MPTRPYRILVVDDEPAIRGFVREALQEEGFIVDVAANGLEALQAIEQTCPALVLLDMRMPIFDGWKFAAALRARNIQIPLVAMTAAVDAHQWATEIGAAGFLAKPFDLPELVATVSRLVEPEAIPG